jgi:hypothetical protein
LVPFGDSLSVAKVGIGKNPRSLEPRNCGNPGQKSVLTNKDVAEWLCCQNPLGWKIETQAVQVVALELCGLFFSGCGIYGQVSFE